MKKNRLPTVWQTPKRGQLIGLTMIALLLCSLSLLHSSNVKALFVSPDRDLLMQQALLVILTLALVVLFMRLAEKIAQQHVLSCRDALFRAMLFASPSREPKRLGVAMNRLITDANSLRQWAGPGIAHLLAGSLLTGFYCLFFLLEVPQLIPSALPCCYFWHYTLDFPIGALPIQRRWFAPSVVA